ncbi:MAG: Ig-like domain-containing protein [Fimbriimonas sp.]
MNHLRFLLPALVLVAGCGGSGSGPSAAPETAGNARISIAWPERTRLVPVASESITVSFLRNSTVVASQTVARPEGGGESTLEFPALPAQALTLRAEAFPNPNGTGTAQATASKSVTIVANTMNTMAITMASTIASVTMNPTIANLAINGTRAVVATPTNSTGATVLVSSATTSWTTTNAAVATVSSTGVVTAHAAGTATIRFTDAESGRFGAMTVNVSSGLGNVDVEIK